MSFNVKKERKKKISEGNKTVDQLYDEKMQYFDRLQESLPRRKSIVTSFAMISKAKKTDRFCDTCLEYMSPTKNICSVCGSGQTVDISNISPLEAKISEIEAREEENNYFLSSHSVLLEYLDTCNTAKDACPQVNFFNLKHTSSDKRQEIIKDYYSINEKIYMETRKITVVDYCKTCKLEIKETKEKDFVCTGCGIVTEKIIDGFSYKDSENYNSVSSSFDYRRINYFTEWLNHIQAKEHINVSDEILNMIKIELQKERITDSSKISHLKIKKILKVLKEPKLYDHIPAIASRICGIQPLLMPPEIINKLKEMFMVIQGPFDMLKGSRKNFFSYPYVIYKFCELLGLVQYMSYFPLLKSREKLIKQDILWKKITTYLNEHDKSSGIEWTFKASC